MPYILPIITGIRKYWDFSQFSNFNILLGGHFIWGTTFFLKITKFRTTNVSPIIPKICSSDNIFHRSIDHDIVRSSQSQTRDYRRRDNSASNTNSSSSSSSNRNYNNRDRNYNNRDRNFNNQNNYSTPTNTNQNNYNPGYVSFGFIKGVFSTKQICNQLNLAHPRVMNKPHTRIVG